jgi:hypothetical protein
MAPFRESTLLAEIMSVERDFHGDNCSDCGLQGCDAIQPCRQTDFWRNMLPPSSEFGYTRIGRLTTLLKTCIYNSNNFPSYTLQT